MAGRLEQIRQRCAICCVAAMTYMQRSGGVCGDELDQHFLVFSDIAVAVVRAALESLQQGGMKSLWREAEIDKARPGNLGTGD